MKRIGILVVAYNASSTLAGVLDRIPEEFGHRIETLLIFDDHSQDATYLVGLGYQQLCRHLPIEVVRNGRNLGYGGNQKAGYRWAIDNQLDIVVLLHGDGQYPPEMLADMVGPIERGECDAVFGSRMLEEGAARRGGMPIYKLLGNRILTSIQNRVVGMSLSEWHSGYRAYNVRALEDVPFGSNSDGFDFDTQIIIQLREAGKRVVEIPIPTYYGDEICYVNGLGYARDVLGDSLRYRAHKMGFGSGETAFASDQYEAKSADDSSHASLLRWVQPDPPLRVLDLGCAGGELSRRLRAMGHTVTGVDLVPAPGIEESVDRFIAADLDQGLPKEAGQQFDLVLAADVLEHVRNPGQLLSDIRAALAPGGSVLVSIPNIAHWYPRIRIAAGRFDYDRRGILDSGHVRFFTRQSFERLLGGAGLSVRRTQGLGVPFEVTARGGVTSPETQAERFSSVLSTINRGSVWLWPALFSYQYLFELVPQTD